MLAADLADLDAACSRFRADSELVALDRADGPPVRLSPLLAGAVAVALRAAELTDGDVDPTVGEAIVAAGYDRDFSLVPPDGPALNLAVRAVPGWRQVHLDPATRTLAMPPGTRLDLGATAKAWAADLAAARITGELGCGVLVGLGGDIAVAGPAPDGGWRIACRTSPAARRRCPTGRPRSWRSPAEGWRPPAPRPGAGGVAAVLWTPHPGSAHRPAAGPRLADDFGDRRDVRGRQRGQHRGHHPRRPGGGLAGRDRAAGPALVGVGGEVETAAVGARRGHVPLTRRGDVPLGAPAPRLRGIS